MNTRGVAELAFVVTGVLAIIAAVRMLPTILALPAWSFSDEHIQGINVPLLVLSHAIPVLVLLVGGLTLVVKCRAFALTFEADTPPDTYVTAADVQSILLTTVGILLLGLSIARLPSYLHNLAVFYSDHEDSLAHYRREATATWVALAGLMLQAAAGVFLVFKGSTLSTLLRRRFDRATVSAADGRCPHCGHWFDLTEYREDAPAYLCSNCKQEIPREVVARRMIREST